MSTQCDRSDAPENVTPAEPVLAAAFPPIPPAAASDDALATVAREALAEARAADRRERELAEALEEHLSPKANELYRELADVAAESRTAWLDVHVAELARHLPGLGPAIRLLWAHVIDERIDRIGACCTTGPVEP